MHACPVCGKPRPYKVWRRCRACDVAHRQKRVQEKLVARRQYHREADIPMPEAPIPREGFCMMCGVVRLSVVHRDGICDGCVDWETEKKRYRPYKPNEPKNDKVTLPQ